MSSRDIKTMQTIIIPQAFENMEEATIGAWRKNENDRVEIGDALCELITEKTTFDLPAEISGTLLKIVAPEKSIVPVGFVIALCGELGENISDALNQAQNANEALQRGASKKSDESALALKVPATTNKGAAPTAGSRIRATPAARRAARELNVKLEDVAAKLPGKVLSEDDVRAFAA